MRRIPADILGAVAKVHEMFGHELSEREATKFLKRYCTFVSIDGIWVHGRRVDAPAP